MEYSADFLVELKAKLPNATRIISAFERGDRKAMLMLFGLAIWKPVASDAVIVLEAIPNQTADLHGSPIREIAQRLLVEARQAIIAKELFKKWSSIWPQEVKV